MARLGSFDPTQLPLGWVDGQAVAEGWFADDLIGAPATSNITATATFTTGGGKIAATTGQVYKSTAALTTGGGKIAATGKYEFKSTAALTTGGGKLASTEVTSVPSTVALTTGGGKLAATEVTRIPSTATLTTGGAKIASTEVTEIPSTADFTTGGASLASTATAGGAEITSTASFTSGGARLRATEQWAYDPFFPKRKKQDAEPVEEIVADEPESVESEPEPLVEAVEDAKSDVLRLSAELRSLLIDASVVTYADFTQADTKKAVRKARQEAKARQVAIEKEKQRQSDAISAMLHDLAAQMELRQAADDAEMLDTLLLVHEYDL